MVRPQSSVLIPTCESLQLIPALEYGSDFCDARVDILYLNNLAGSESFGELSIKELTVDPPDEIPDTVIEGLVNRANHAFPPEVDLRFLHSDGPIAESTIKYTEALNTDLVVLSVDSKRIECDPQLETEIERIRHDCPVSFTIVRE